MDTISIYTKNHKNLCISDKKNPLSKGRGNNNVFYITGLALWLTKYEKTSAMEIASAIASHFSAESADVFSVQIVPPGWIYLQLTDPAVAAWLQSVVTGRQGDVENEGEGIGDWGTRGPHSPKGVGIRGEGVTGTREQGEREMRGHSDAENNQYPITHYPLPITHSQFPIQYAHARCCSLVRMAERERLIISADAIPWLHNQQELRFNHPAELGLVSELVQAVDELECSDSSGRVKWEKVGLSLSQAFDQFWRNCRIWGEVKTSSPELAQARLGLVMATHAVLRRLLEEKLSILAPLEL